MSGPGAPMAAPAQGVVPTESRAVRAPRPRGPRPAARSLSCSSTSSVDHSITAFSLDEELQFCDGAGVAGEGCSPPVGLALASFFCGGALLMAAACPCCGPCARARDVVLRLPGSPAAGAAQARRCMQTCSAQCEVGMLHQPQHRRQCAGDSAAPGKDCTGDDAEPSTAAVAAGAAAAAPGGDSTAGDSCSVAAARGTSVLASASWQTPAAVSRPIAIPLPMPPSSARCKAAHVLWRI
jgi:hypothetical protein